MKREEVLANLEKVERELETIMENRRTRAYISVSKFIDGVGMISDLSSLRELVDVKVVVENKLKSSEEEDAMKGLGLTEKEIKSLSKGANKRFMGLTKDEWNQDIETKLEELREYGRVNELENAKNVLEKYLSNDDQFQRDTESIDELVGSLA